MMNLYSKHRVTLFLTAFYFLFFFKNPLRRCVTFCTFLAIFRLLKTFLSYQQVINNETFSTQLLKLFSANEQIFERNAEAHKKCINPLVKKR